MGEQFEGCFLFDFVDLWC